MKAIEPRQEESRVPKVRDDGIPAPATLVKPVDNAIKILRYLSLIKKPSTVTVMSRELKINPSTCFNILRTLVWNGILDFDRDTKAYSTGVGAVDLANRALLKHGGVAEAMQPHIEDVAHKYNVTITIWRKISEDRKMLVSIVDSPAAVRIHMRLGQRLPLLVGASGLLMVAFGGLEEDEIRRQFAGLTWNRPLSVGEYLARAATARQQGWSLDDGQYIAAMLSIAAPIFHETGLLRGCIVASAFTGQHDKKTVDKLIADIRGLAQDFTASAE